MGLRHRREAQRFLDFGEHIYAVNSIKAIQNPTRAPINRFNICKLMAQRTFYYLIFVLVIFTTATGIFLFYPLWLLLLEGQKIWILPVLIPGTTLDTTYHFIINLNYQILCAFMAAAGSTGFDLFFTMCCCHHTFLVLLIESTLDELNEVYTEKILSPLTRKIYLINFLKQLQDLDSWVGESKRQRKKVLIWNCFLVRGTGTHWCWTRHTRVCC